MSLVTVSSAFYSVDAQLVRSRLEAAGFHAVVIHELMPVRMRGSAGGVLVQVPDAEAADAKEFLASEPPPDEPPQA